MGTTDVAAITIGSQIISCITWSASNVGTKYGRAALTIDADSHSYHCFAEETRQTAGTLLPLHEH